MRHNERGIVSLLGVMIACAIMLVLLAAIAPAIIRNAQTTDAISAASTMAQLNAAEFAFAQSYQMYPAPIGLTGTLSQTLSCSNPMLLSGAQISNPPGYTIKWTPKVVKASATCPSVTGYSGYTVSLDPDSKLQGTRHFYSDTDDAGGSNLIHFAEGRPATTSDPIFSAIGNSLIVVANGANNGSGGTPSCPAGSGETWNGSSCMCPQNQTLTGGVCTTQITCQTYETQISGQCYTTFPSAQGYPELYFYNSTAVFTNTDNWPTSITATGNLTFQFNDANTITVSGQFSNFSYNSTAWQTSGQNLPTLGPCVVSGSISLSGGGTFSLSSGSGPQCYMSGGGTSNWGIPGASLVFTPNGLSYSLNTSNGQIQALNTNWTGNTPMLLTGALNPMPN